MVVEAVVVGITWAESSFEYNFTFREIFHKSKASERLHFLLHVIYFLQRIVNFLFHLASF